jgi:iron complex outermembrane receptor protein
VGAVWHAADNLNLYFSYGQGFETPTFAELAYKPSGPGLNFNLNPATSTAYELGLKWLPDPSQRNKLAIFTAQTKQEIVVNTATGGRTTYANAGRTERRGVEAGRILTGYGVTAHVNAWLLAQCRSLHDGHPAGVVPAGAKLPGALATGLAS